MNNLVSQINSKIQDYHNPDLLKKDEAPNANWIYKIWEDGTITHEKGGFAYGRRSMFDEVSAVCNHSFTNHLLVFPMHVPRQSIIGSINEGYAMVTRDHAYEIRKIIVQLYMVMLEIEKDKALSYLR
jgi:hypothetical protein